MALLNDTDLAKLQAQQAIETKMRELHAQMVSYFNQIMTLVWSHPTLTPQQIMDQYGTNAHNLFDMAGLCQQTIESALPNTTLLGPTYNFTINADGTVTIGAPL